MTNAGTTNHEAKKSAGRGSSFIHWGRNGMCGKGTSLMPILSVCAAVPGL